MIGILSKLFGGSKSDKDVKKIQPVVAEINQFFNSYQALSNDDLRNKTEEFRERIAAHLADIDQQIAAKKAEADADNEDDIQVMGHWKVLRGDIVHPLQWQHPLHW